MGVKPQLCASMQHLSDCAALTPTNTVASVKIDGIRALMLGGMKLVSRHIKPIPNRYIRTVLESMPQLEYCDGEIITYTNGVMDEFNTVQSKVMTERGAPDFKWCIFDNFKNHEKPFSERMKLLPQESGKHFGIVQQIPVASQEKLDALEFIALRDKWEGLIVRSLDAPYKYGRSTLREGYLVKLVRKNRAEGKVVGFKERMHNANEATVNELGYTARSSHKENLIGRDDLGGFDVEWDGICDGKLFKGLEKMELPINFNVGTGLSDDMRAEYWAMRPYLLGKFITFEFRGIGTNGRPRFPVFLGFRED